MFRVLRPRNLKTCNVHTNARGRVRGENPTILWSCFRSAHAEHVSVLLDTRASEVGGHSPPSLSLLEHPLHAGPV